MDHLFAGVALIAIGCGLIIFRKPLAEHSVGFQTQVFRLPFGQKTLDTTYWVVPGMGVAVIVVGLLTIFGVIK